MTANKNNILIAIVGETASGKSSLAHDIAILTGAEIISADSRAVYKKMDIGTAKPSKQEQSEVPYHLIDMTTPDKTYTAGQFKADAHKAITQIRARGNMPILVGGSGMYIDSILFDYQFGSGQNSEKRQQLNNTSLEDLQDLAKKLGLFPDKSLWSNKRHLISAIENKDRVQTRNNMIDGVIVIGISRPRNQLRKRIEQRVELMFKQGLRKEVDELVNEYGWDNEAMTGIGYREFKPYYEGKISMTEVKKSIAKNTLKILAKHQRTWFKRNQEIVWFEKSDEAKSYILNKLTEVGFKIS